MSQPEDILSPLLSTGTYKVLVQNLGEDLGISPQTLANNLFPMQMDEDGEGEKKDGMDSDFLVKGEPEEVIQATQETPRIGEWKAMRDKCSRKLEVSFKEPPKVTKNMTCTYLPSNNTLYARPMRRCSTVVRVGGGVPEDCKLHLSPRFSLTFEPVRMCPYHASAGHLVQVDPSLLNYSSYNITYTHLHGHQVVSIDLKASPSTNDTEVVFPIVFHCMSSCQGGIHKRPIHVLFQLQQGAQVLAERTVNVWVGTCPGRTRMKDERKEEEGVIPKEGVLKGVSGGVSKELVSKRGVSEGIFTNLCTKNTSKQDLESLSENKSSKQVKRDFEMKENQGEFKLLLRSYKEWKACNHFKHLLQRHSEEGCVCYKELGVQNHCLVRLLE